MFFSVKFDNLDSMNRLNYLFLLLLVFSTISAFAQQKQPVYFRAGRVITNPDSADYYRVITSENDTSFSFTEYRKDGTRMEATATGSILYPDYIGTAIFYYKTGKIAVKKEFNVHGWLAKITGYYPNGSLIYITYAIPRWPLELVVYDADSSGHVHIVNGNGARQETDSLRTCSEHYTMRGPYKDGFKDGIWTGSDDRGWAFEQTYRKGIVTSATVTTNDGKKYHYRQFFQFPEFDGKFDEFNRSILANLKNKKDTLSLEFLKPGVLHLSYVINYRGEVTQLKGFRKNKGGMVALELKGNRPRCAPAKLRGVPVPFVVADNRTVNLGLANFNTDVYLNGQIRSAAYRYDDKR
jgi:hypothetical protein